MTPEDLMCKEDCKERRVACAKFQDERDRRISAEILAVHNYIKVGFTNVTELVSALKNDMVTENDVEKIFNDGTNSEECRTRVGEIVKELAATSEFRDIAKGTLDLRTVAGVFLFTCCIVWSVALFYVKINDMSTKIAFLETTISTHINSITKLP